MNRHYERYLFNRYPLLYQGRHKPITRNLMAFGFACDDGWFHIINALSQRLHGQYDHYNSKYQERVGRAGELVFPDLEESGWNYRITQEGIDKLKN